MNVTQSFKLAIKSLRASKLRALLTMLGIIIGVAAVIVIISLGNGLTGMVEPQVEKVGVNQIYAYVWGRGDGTTMAFDPEHMYEFTAKYPEVFSGVTPWVNCAGGVRAGEEKFEKTGVCGVSEAMYSAELGGTLDGDRLAKGRYIRYVDVAQRGKVCVIGAYLEQEAFGGDALGKTLRIGGIPYTVVGVLARRDSVMEEGGGDDSGIGLGAAHEEVDIGLRAGEGGLDFLRGFLAVVIHAVAGGLLHVGFRELPQDGGVAALQVVAGQ